MRYCPYFCEENVWHLCLDDVVTDGARVVSLDDRRAVFISNDRRAVPMDRQRAGQGNVIAWDYHVVLFALTRGGWRCWDLDHEGGVPQDLAVWMSSTFLVGAPLEVFRTLTGKDVDAPRFRVVEAAEFLELFSSDRSHMMDDRRRPTRPFPDWPAIDTGESTLMRFIDTRAAWVGEVFSYDDLRLHFCMK